MEILTSFRRIMARSRPRITAVALVILWLLLKPVTTFAAESLEYTVKAAYLSKFGIYVEWPEKAFSSATSAINICVTVEDPFGTLLDEAARGQRIGDRELIVRRLQSVTRDSGCHILYIGGTDSEEMRTIIESVRGSGVLTVTDTGGSPGDIGIIDFVLKDNRVRFNVDDAAAEHNGLTISSRLLVLALNVKQRR